MGGSDSAGSTDARRGVKPSGLILVPIAALHALALAVCGAEATSLLLVAELGIVGAWASVGWLQAVSQLRGTGSRPDRHIVVQVLR